VNGARHVLITGASRGIGAHLVRHYLAQDHVVIGCARGAAPVMHKRYTHMCADVADDQAVQTLVGDIRKRFGALDVLINNAGVASMNAVALTPPATARRVIDTNFFGPVMLTHAAIRLLRRSGTGRIVNLSTIAVPLRLSGEAIYAASKSAIETYTRIAARELGSLGITVNALGPSVVKTALTAGVPEAKLARLVQEQAVQRLATGNDVANVIDFFLRPESALVTGQVVYLGGFG